MTTAAVVMPAGGKNRGVPPGTVIEPSLRDRARKIRVVGLEDDVPCIALIANDHTAIVPRFAKPTGLALRM